MLHLHCTSTNDHLREGTVGGDLGLETGGLASGELGHAGVVGVVHVVVCWLLLASIKEPRLKTNDLRMGSTPPPEQVSRPTGQPEAGLASGGVSATWSPTPEQPPWKVW